ncbi:cyclic nucleotide-binding-like protein [Chytriomyces sp. MP71]|nr:cyclic nucleotide-binding-like protein [Chytriomyces sp. MP71]
MKLPEVSSRCALIQRMYVTLDRMVGMSISTTIPIAFVMMSFIHINACEMFFFGKRSGFVGWDAAFLGLDDATHVEFYAWTFMQVGVSHMFPNSFIPQTVTEQVIGSLLVICAAVLYALFIGAISNSVMSVNPAGRLYFHKLEQLHDYVKWKNLAPETEKRLFKFYETKYRGKYFDEDLLLAEMNESLRAVYSQSSPSRNALKNFSFQEISLENTRDLIEKVPFLRRTENDGRDVIFLGRLAAALHAQYYVAGDYITKQGESGKDMFFIRSGKLDVFVNDRKVVSLFDGAYIGEVALLAHVLRTATVQAAKPSVLYRLTHIDFHSILEDFVDMKDRIDRLAEERVAAIYEKRT